MGLVCRRVLGKGSVTSPWSSHAQRAQGLSNLRTHLQQCKRWQAPASLTAALLLELTLCCSFHCVGFIHQREWILSTPDQISQEGDSVAPVWSN